jgi:cell division inhibitor SepF
MPGAMRKLGLYLGLVEDEEDRDRHDAEVAEDDRDLRDDREVPTAVAARRWSAAEEPGRSPSPRRSTESGRARGSVALDTPPRIAAAPVVDDTYRITTLHPRTYNEARTIGEHFRQGTPVIMNLTEMDDVDAKRLVDFAAGLIFGLRGSIERVTNKVFLLSPEHVQVTAEDKARIAEGGFFNQS